MQFEPVWISTMAHLDRLHQLFRHTSALKKAFGIYDIPEGFPYAQYGSILLTLKAPLVMVANGIMHIENQKIRYLARPMQVRGSQIHNLQINLEFDIHADELISIERYLGKSPVSKHFDLPFTRIRSSRSGLQEDFLVCVGGVGPSMGRVKAKSEELFVALKQIRPE